MALEIERKFLLAERPEALIQEGKIKVLHTQNIWQTYLAIDDTQELRVRKLKNEDTGAVSYTHTFKNGNGVQREEIEYEITEGIYEQVVKAFGFVPLTKSRITADWDGRTIEIDVYDQIHLSVLEVEFQSLEEANTFEAPLWFGEDISTQKQYSNKTVWKKLQGDKWTE
ncbi:CYTH domain-containing protein [Paenibacillus sp. CAU 1782]